MCRVLPAEEVSPSLARAWYVCGQSAQCAYPASALCDAVGGARFCSEVGIKMSVPFFTTLVSIAWVFYLK
ncbi:unnamed protein product [Ixodes hexagonus]